MPPQAEPAAQTAANALAVPTHVAIIMDGNGRWAHQRGLPRIAGHRAGTENIRRIVETCVEIGVKILTLYAFSTENWRRPIAEVSGLMLILGEVIDRETNKLRENGVQVRHIGAIEQLSADLQRRIKHAVDSTRHNDGLILNVAFNYGGRAEIVQAVRRMLADQVNPDEVDEHLFASYLYTGTQHDPDLIIRTGGEWRLSNFLLWQAAYAEYWSTPTLWPDFGRDQFVSALEEFGQRQRRFGKI
jgi:undecaprenyl diphosphate synthase